MERGARLRQFGPVLVVLLAFVGLFVASAHRLHRTGSEALSSISDAQWSASQAEMELYRLLSAADRYALGVSGTTREDVADRIDLAWSRLSPLIEGEESELLRAATEAPVVVPELEAALGELATAVSGSARPREVAALARERIGRLLPEMRRVVLAAMHATSERQASLQRRVSEVSRNYTIAVVGVLCSTAILLLLLFREARASRLLLQQANAARDRIQHLAHHDSLTGLPNRLLFHDRLAIALAGALRRGQQVAIHLIDVDQFKEINDRFGHAGGDALLIELGRRLRRCIRECDTLARVGGDELVVLQIDIDGPEQAEVLARRLHASAGEAIAAPAQGFVPTISVGIALAPSHGADADALLRCADLALYRAKAGGRDRSVLYHPTMQRTAPDGAADQRVIWIRQSGPEEMPNVLAKSP